MYNSILYNLFRTPKKMSRFCKNCNNLLVVDLANDSLSFNCMSCLSEYNSEPNDSLRYEDVKTGNLFIFSKILDNAHRDPVNLKAKKQCKKCKHEFAKQVRLGESLRLINICEKCQNRWVES